MITLLLLISIILICYGKKSKKKKEIAKRNEKIVIGNISNALINEITYGKIPRFNYPYMNYGNGEECHYIDNARYFVQSNSKYYQRFSTGISSKGKSNFHRTNVSTIYPVTTTVTRKYNGDLIITNHRVIFNCDDYSLIIPLSCIITFTPYDNKIVINSGKNIDTIYVANGYVVFNLLNNIFRERNKV